jgi:hypothetical protein
VNEARARVWEVNRHLDGQHAHAAEVWHRS